MISALTGMAIMAPALRVVMETAAEASEVA
jgi:hypothetical protein